LLFVYSLHYKYKNENRKSIVQKSQKNEEKIDKMHKKERRWRKKWTTFLGDITKIEGSN